jgi:aminopeptidase N/puromycin-sensitive aminopeptidase
MKKIFLSILTLSLFPIAASAQKLPEIATPHHYILTLAPDLKTETFTGDEVIHGDTLKPTNKIVLNALEIEFQEATIQALPAAKGGKPGEVQKATVSLDPQSEMATLSFPNEIPAGPFELKIKYKGILNGQLRGFYLSKGNGRKYAVSQMEPTDARRAFPSFDEPAYKAPFDISLIVDKGDTAISNGTIVSDTPGPGADKHTIKFSMTPKMSTYLVAMMVGDFKCVSDQEQGIPIRVCSTPDKVQYTKVALGDAKDILRYYNQYYGIKYPFKKLDIIAFPDFSAGAMENTAAITYRETLLLVDDKNVSNKLRKEVADVLAHEMAHQWFGDLVTMQWWNDIWLNEGFATWMSPKPVKAAHAEWNVGLDEVQQSGSAMNIDSTKSTRAIRTNATTTNEIAELFDGIAYDKTASVLRMVESYLGEQPFRSGVNNYLKQHAYANATAEDFWGAMSHASGKPVDKIMQSYVTQPGVPLVSVKAKCEGKKTEVALEQQRFFYNKEALAAGSQELWQIPVCYSTAGGAKKCVLLDQKQKSFELQGCGEGINFNSGGQGYYRVSYDPESLNKLTASVGKMSPQEKVSLLDNQWALTRADRNTVGDYLALLEGMKNSRERAVLERIDDRLEYIHDNLLTEADRPHFEAWVQQLLRPALTEFGWKSSPSDDAERRTARARVIKALGFAGNDPDVIAKSRDLVMAALNGKASLEPEMRSTLVDLTAKHGDTDLYDRYFQQARASRSPEEFYTWLYGLPAFEKPELVKRTLEYSLSPDIRNQDFQLFLASTAEPVANQQIAWNFLKSNWSTIAPKLATYSPGTVIKTAQYFCEPSLKADVESFFTQHAIAGADRSLRQTVERIGDCLNLKQQQQSNLSVWLQKQPTTAAGGAVEPKAR